MTTVAVMQPYFVPYAGYFCLFAAADVFVAFDCVQFPRRGWVHRNRFAVTPGVSDWLTLPVRKCQRDTRIVDLDFQDDAAARLAHDAQRFPLLRSAWNDVNPLLELVRDPGSGGVADYLCAQLKGITALLRLPRDIVRSSSLGIAPELHGQDRVIAIVKALGASRYVNSSGGRALYEPAAFGEHGIDLRFLAPYAESTDSILTLLLTASAAEVAALIHAQTVLLP
jgi:hypothetical protein